jgi:hypothetical protein
MDGSMDTVNRYLSKNRHNTIQYSKVQSGTQWLQLSLILQSCTIGRSGQVGIRRETTRRPFSCYCIHTYHVMAWAGKAKQGRAGQGRAGQSDLTLFPYGSLNLTAVTASPPPVFNSTTTHHSLTTRSPPLGGPPFRIGIWI